MMFWGTIFLLSLIQGITEFLPVSSSGHLVFIPYFLDFTYQGRSFDVSVHFGSLLAVIVYLRVDLYQITKDLFSKNRFKSEGFATFKKLLFATIPTIIIGYILYLLNVQYIKFIEIVGWTTIIFGILLGFSDRVETKEKYLPNFKHSIIIGLIQSLSLIPGVSRSGIVITSGRFLGYSRINSSKFALLLSIPVIIAAMTLNIIDIISKDNILFSIDLFLGFIVSFLFAILTIKIFMKYIEQISLKIFVFYRIILGIFILYYAYFL